MKELAATWVQRSISFKSRIPSGHGVEWQIERPNLAATNRFEREVQT